MEWNEMMMIAKETAAFRGTLSAALSQTLPAARLATVNLGAVLAAARPALEAGWPGEGLARQALIGVAEGGVNPGALLVTHLRDLATMAPPPAPDAPTPPGRRAVVTAPQALPECAACGVPFRRGDHPSDCPDCGAPLRLVEFDHQAAVRAA